MVKRYIMVIKYVLRLSQYVTCGYMLHVRSTPFMSCGYEVRVMWDEVRVTLVRSTWYIVHLSHYEVRGTWVSLYDFPPLVAFKGLFSFRKWFCFLELKIKNGW